MPLVSQRRNMPTSLVCELATKPTSCGSPSSRQCAHLRAVAGVERQHLELPVLLADARERDVERPVEHAVGHDDVLLLRQPDRAREREHDREREHGGACRSRSSRERLLESDAGDLGERASADRAPGRSR